MIVVWFPWACPSLKINPQKIGFFPQFPFRIGIPERSITSVEAMSLDLFLLFDTIPCIFPRSDLQSVWEFVPGLRLALCKMPLIYLLGWKGKERIRGWPCLTASWDGDSSTASLQTEAGLAQPLESAPL